MSSFVGIEGLGTLYVGIRNSEQEILKPAANKETEERGDGEAEYEKGNYCNLLKLSNSELLDLATNLISKHQTYLDLIFSKHPKTFADAIYDPEIGWQSIIRESLNYDQTTILMIDHCMKLFHRAIDRGFEHHQNICDTKLPDCKPLSYGGDKCDVIQMKVTYRVINSLNDQEAKILSVLLALDRKIIEEFKSREYTSETIIELINKLKETNRPLLGSNSNLRYDETTTIQDNPYYLDDDDLPSLEDDADDLPPLEDDQIEQTLNNIVIETRKKKKLDGPGDMIASLFFQMGIVAEISISDEEEYNTKIDKEYNTKMEDVD